MKLFDTQRSCCFPSILAYLNFILLCPLGQWSVLGNMSQASEQLNNSMYQDVSRISELWPRIAQFLTCSSLSQTFCPLSSRCFWWRPEGICHSNEMQWALNVEVALVGGRPWSELIWYCHSNPFGWGWRRPSLSHKHFNTEDLQIYDDFFKIVSLKTHLWVSHGTFALFAPATEQLCYRCATGEARPDLDGLLTVTPASPSGRNTRRDFWGEAWLKQRDVYM